jgi:cyanophycin synthetase
VRQGFREALKAARRGCDVVVEEQLPGRDHRILVIGGKVVAVAERVPARVEGDGRSSIAEWVDILNRDPRRGDGHEKVMTRVKVDDHLKTVIAGKGMSLESVPPAGAIVYLRDTANLSTGGTAVDRTEEIHPDNIAIAEQAAAVIGLDVAGIDFLSPDISRSVRESGGGIVEINAAPGFRMHLEPSEGRRRDVARPVLRALFPPGGSSRIPIIAITGTNGKSTTTRMVGHVLQHSGMNVGLTSTSGVYFNGRLLLAVDASGPKSARMVLRNPKVDVAVLETARGGILREGLGFECCDVGAVLNVSADHLGLKGVDTLEDLADVKSVVTESVCRSGVSVLNADDAQTARLARHAGGRPAYFSLRAGDGMPPFLRRHIAEGGLAAIREPSRRGGDIVLYREGERSLLMACADIPATLGGKAEFNVQNAMAAICICVAQNVADDVIRSALSSFASSFEQCPGRLNIYDGHPFRVVLDYAHNPGSLHALGDLLSRMRPDYERLIGMVSIPGDRRDDDIRAMGELAAGIFDEIVFREAPDGRGRPPGAVNALLSEGAIAAGFPPEHVRSIFEELDAADACLQLGRPGDLIVLLPTRVEQVWRQVLAFSPTARRPERRAFESQAEHV